MRVGEQNQELEHVLRRLVQVRAELLAALPPDNEDIRLTVTDDGQQFTVRVLWHNCLLVASETQRRATSRAAPPVQSAPQA